MNRKNNILITLAISILILLCISILGWSHRIQAASKITWEYKVINTSVEPPQSPMGDIERGLSQLGADGWELVQFNRSEISESRGIWIFKRPR
jgi:hypothetical protein